MFNKDANRESALNAIGILATAFLTALLVFLLSGCGKDVQIVSTPTCTIRNSTDEGTPVLTCPDGSHVEIKNGNPGLDGKVGATGSVGASGVAGTSCSVATVVGGALITCGATSSFIANGAAGAAGQNGAAGAAGQNGKDATPVKAVQFCANQGATTYGHFPEFGFLINGALYATYWDGQQAWTAKIVPGTYISTATGLGCTFTVNADLTITEN